VKFYLLLGAGFSRNWGGWLATEALEYLLSCGEITSALRGLLIEHKNRGGFEGALGRLQQTLVRYGGRPDANLQNLQSAIRRMFADMDRGFASMQRFEFTNERDRLVKTFLTKFDAIFTLNQDLLLERHYLAQDVSLLSNGRWNGHSIPGMEFRHGNDSQLHSPDTIMLVPTHPSDFHIPERCQPYIKLHGSANWADSQFEDVMVMGDNKSDTIQRYPILKWNGEQFLRALRGPAARLMVIGYGFGDDHINLAIREAVTRHGLRVFIIDPMGMDVLDKNIGQALITVPHDLAATIWPSVIGASRRSLTSTFGSDLVEHAKVMRFFDQ
jgi:hypothetical protein